MEDDPAYAIAITLDRQMANVDCRLGAGIRHSAFDIRHSTFDNTIRKAIEATLRRHRTPAAWISVALVDDGRMAHLNEFHLKREGPTDVLAFDLRDPPTADHHADGAVEGEIVVSVDTARREADKRGHSPGAELALYAVHGTLHLLGYDDQNEDDAACMHEVEDEILSAIGVGAVYRANPR